MKDLATIPLPPVADSTIKKTVAPELQWMRASDGLQLMCRIWRGNIGAPVILYLHGIEGHGQWFENTAGILNARGITVYAPDRRGSGLNPRDRGHLSDHKVFLEDVEGMLQRICSDHAGHPIILWGNCWGAKAAVILAQDQIRPAKAREKDGPPPVTSYPIAGLVLTSPALFSKLDFDLKTKAEIAVNHLAGGRRALRKWALPLTPAMFTDNPPYLEYLEKDPLRVTEVTSTFLVESHKLTGLAEKTAPNISKPIIILQPGNDQVVDTEKLQKWYEKVKSPQKSMRIFPDAYHSLDFDANWFKEYTHLMSEWLLSRSPVID